MEAARQNINAKVPVGGRVFYARNIEDMCSMSPRTTCFLSGKIAEQMAVEPENLLNDEGGGTHLPSACLWLFVFLHLKLLLIVSRWWLSSALSLSLALCFLPPLSLSLCMHANMLNASVLFSSGKTYGFTQSAG